ncbi:MAG TPA: S8 family serine peptidase [Thermoanaerobaculia bacterium]|nr:S8 family serine peptidase [Thermoanaerobaculia bacterium]
MTRFRSAAGALLAALVLLSACSGYPRAASGPEGVAPNTSSESEQVMVMLAPAPPFVWTRATRELEQMYGLRTIYSWTLGSLGEQCVVFEVPRGRSAQDVLPRLASDPRVGSAQPIETYTTQAGEADPYAKLQHGAQTLRLEQAHRWATGKGVRVAVVDTGVDLDHPDLRGRIAVARNFVDRGEQTFTTDVHGTAVAGLIAASAGNEIGIVGVAPEAEIWALKACWQQPPGAREAVCNSYTLAKALDFAIVQKAQVLNMSLAGPKDPLLARLLGTALSRGIIVVAADGGDERHSFPASLDGVLGVLGSDDLKGGIQTPPGGKPTAALAAPAVDVLTTVPRGSYDFFSGSSMAAAQVAGVAALLLEKDPRLTPDRLAGLIRKTAHPIAGTGNPHTVSQVDACAALASVTGGECR